MLVPLMNATFTLRCTRRGARMTTRKVPDGRPLPLAGARSYVARFGKGGLKPALLSLALALGGCATPGPMHVYFSEAPSPEVIGDAGGERPIDVPSFIEPSDNLTGLAYDPFTDHLFLRLAPGNDIRVVDRPARALKREFTIEGISTTGGGDLAVRPRDGHIFLIDQKGAAIAETTRLGKLLRTFSLAEVSGPVTGLAYDAVANRLLALHADGRKITLHDPDGKRLGEFTLARQVGPSLAMDGERQELYAPLAGAERAIGVFDFKGQLLRTLPLTSSFVDVGPRSFVRVF